MESVKELIERRAYELFLKRGGHHGYAIQDWAQAEKEILASLDSKPKSKASVVAPAAAPKAPAKKKAAAPKKK